jgi:hypothetical protein
VRRVDVAAATLPGEIAEQAFVEQQGGAYPGRRREMQVRYMGKNKRFFLLVPGSRGGSRTAPNAKQRTPNRRKGEGYSQTVSYGRTRRRNPSPPRDSPCERYQPRVPSFIRAMEGVYL